MSTVVVAAALIVAAAIAAGALRRRKPEPPTQAQWAVPSQLDRADFDHPEIPWLVVVFSSTTCAACEQAIAKAMVLASPQVAVEDVSYQARPDLHKRYAIEAAPTIVVADGEGVVHASFTTTPSATDLWAAVAEARFPGSTPQCHQHDEGVDGCDQPAGASPESH